MFIEWARKHADISIIFSIANGGLRTKLTAIKLKREGLLPGVPDLFLPIARRGFFGMFIEMKRKKGGIVSTVQKNIMTRLRANGYRVVVCNGHEEAIKTTVEYMQMPSW